MPRRSNDDATFDGDLSVLSLVVRRIPNSARTLLQCDVDAMGQGVGSFVFFDRRVVSSTTDPKLLRLRFSFSSYDGGGGFGRKEQEGSWSP